MKLAVIALGLLVLAAASESRDLREDHCQVKHCEVCSYHRYKQCKTCSEGYWNWQGECLDCVYAVDWCEKCTNDGKKCFQCQPGFFVDERGLCASCKNGISMCEFCDHNGRTCYRCIDPWELKDGKCFYGAWPSSGYKTNG